MLTLDRRDTGTGTPHDQLVLPFELRQRSRLRAVLQSGREVALSLVRGSVLRGGDRLATSAGEIVLIVAAGEAVATATTPDRRLLALVAYHLGNRHVPLQVGDGWLRFEQDHVLEEMVQGLGAAIVREQAPFEPEGGAYGGGGHHHGHDHAPDGDHHHHHHD